MMVGPRGWGVGPVVGGVSGTWSVVRFIQGLGAVFKVDSRWRTSEPDLWRHPESSPLDNSVSPPSLRGFVDEADGCADDHPLNEVGDGLVDGQREADVQVDVVVDREGADREKADECAEVYA